METVIHIFGANGRQTVSMPGVKGRILSAAGDENRDAAFAHLCKTYPHLADTDQLRHTVDKINVILQDRNKPVHVDFDTMSLVHEILPSAKRRCVRGTLPAQLVR